MPRLLAWLVGKLGAQDAWVIVDHCRRPNLTRAARDLLIKFAGAIDDGNLPRVRLILADIDRRMLPGSLSWSSREDTATLPDATAVRAWLKSLHSYARKRLSDQEFDDS